MAWSSICGCVSTSGSGTKGTVSALPMALLVIQHLSSRLRKLTGDYLKACKTLAETEREIEERQQLLSPEVLLRAETLNQLLLAPEILY